MQGSAGAGLHFCLHDVRRTPRAPLGFSLNMFAWYIDQTVGGAVATGTHGSSLRWGSLSSQVWPL